MKTSKLKLSLSLMQGFSQVYNPPWNLYGSGSNLFLENTPYSTKEINLYQNSGWRLSMQPFTISGGIGDYTFFPASNNTITFSHFYTCGSAKTSRVHFQSFQGSGLLSFASHSYDWGQNIISVVSRPNTVSFVMNHNGRDRIYHTGSGYIAAEKGFWNFSDENLKQNITEISDALNKVKSLRGVYFDFNEEDNCDSCHLDSNFFGVGDFGTQMGLIAQEVEDVVPEVVREEHNGYKAVAYANLVGLLIEAIKELDTKVNGCCGIDSYSSNQANKSQTSKKNSEIEYSLSQNIPNPSDGSTTINYKIPPNNKDNQIAIFDLQGKLIKAYKSLSNETTSLIINKGDLPAGMYYYTLIVNGREIDTKKMILTN